MSMHQVGCGWETAVWERLHQSDSVDSKGPMSIAVPELLKPYERRVRKPRCFSEISKCSVLAEFLFKTLCLAYRMCLGIRVD